jgi:fatty acyl-CoA reductase
VKARVRDRKLLERRLTELGIAEANRHGWNDTYTFTKWMGEQLAMRGMTGRAMTIVRPSIIESMATAEAVSARRRIACTSAAAVQAIRS